MMTLWNTVDNGSQWWQVMYMLIWLFFYLSSDLFHHHFVEF